MVNDRVNITIQHNLTINALEGVEFSEEFISKFTTRINTLAEAEGIAIESCDTSNKALGFLLRASDLGKMQQFLDKAAQEAKFFTTYGANAELMEKLLETYPEILDSPRAREVAGAFDNLINKVKEVLSDKKAWIDKGGKPVRSSKVDKAMEHRTEALAPAVPSHLKRLQE